MAIFSKIVIAASAFAAMAAAVPLNARLVTSMVTETAYTTVNVAVTLWVDEDGKPLSTVAQGIVAAVPSTSTSVTTTPSSAPASSAAAPITPTSVATPPSPAPATFAPVQSQQVAASSPSSSYTYSQSTTSMVLAATPSSTQPAKQVASAGDNVAVANTDCSGPSSACSGDVTHYDGGQSACGPIVDSNTQMAIALPYEFMGTASNNNPYCGKTLTIQNPTTGVQVQAYVADKCMGCTGRSIDLTNALFAAVAPSCDGRCSGFEWWFN